MIYGIRCFQNNIFKTLVTVYLSVVSINLVIRLVDVYVNQPARAVEQMSII